MARGGDGRMARGGDSQQLEFDQQKRKKEKIGRKEDRGSLLKHK